jgi:hypothetical protein
MKKRKKRNYNKFNSISRAKNYKREDSNNILKNAQEEKFLKKFNLGFRILYAIVAWILLGFQIPLGSSWFISIILYQFPFLIDYLSFKPYDSKRNIIKNIEVIYSLSIIIISFLGCAGVFVIIQNGQDMFIQMNMNFIALRGKSINIFFYWILLLGTVCLNTIDYGQYITQEEKKLDENISKNVIA